MEANKVERGTTLQGEYVLLECIGDDGGLVFRAQRRHDGATVVVRVFAGLEREVGERLIEHAERARRLRHPVLAAVSGAGFNGDDVYVVEELVEGRSLAELAERSGIPPLARAVEIALQLCRGLESAHRHGVAHDALGPRNVLLRGGAGDSSPLQVKLVDLAAPGFARPWPPALSRALYMAPEQLATLRIARSGHGATPAMNLYSLAALLYDLCTGGPPLPATSLDELAEAHAGQRLMPPSRINPAIPSTLDALLLRALSADPARRFASVADLIDALSALRLGTGASGVQPVAVLPRPASERAPEPERATWHGSFDERPTTKTELPPPRFSDATPLRPPPLPVAGRPVSLPAPPPLPRASLEPPATPPSAPALRRSAPPRGAFSAPPAPPEPEPEPSAREPRTRRTRLVVAAAGSALLALFAYALSLPLPEERVRTTPLAALPEPARPAGPRANPPAIEPATSEREVERASNASSDVGAEGVATEHEPATPSPRSELASREGAASVRAARGFEPRSARTVVRSRGGESARAVDVAPAHGSSRDDDAHEQASTAVPAEPIGEVDAGAARSGRPAEGDADGTVRSGRATSIMAGGADAHASAERHADGSERLKGSAKTEHASAEGDGARLEGKASGQGQGQGRGGGAGVRISGLSVRGSLPSSQVAQGVARVLPQLNECYRKAASAPQRVQVAFELDEQGRARSPKLRGASAGLAACLNAALRRVASRRAPDTGTVAAELTLELLP